MIKNILFCLLLFPFSFCVWAQTGTAGVGTSTNNVLWLKADVGTSSMVNLTPISSWDDQSGNGNNVTQTVSAQQPSFTTNVINGFPAILFDNVNGANLNDKMIGPDSPLLDNTTAYTFFYVTRPMNFGDARVIVSKRTGVAIDQSFMLFYYNSNKLNIDIQTNDNRFPSNTTFSTATNYIGCLTYDGAIATASLRCTLYNEETVDRTATETNTSIPDNNSPLLVGTTDATDTRPFGGYISEIVIYREALSTAKRIIVNNYLSAKYDIALSANDKYQGDQATFGNYDREVAGIGQEGGLSNSSFSASATGGLGVVTNSGLDNGDYMMLGHAVVTNTTITTDVGGMTGSNKARWLRIWNVDVTNVSTNINVNVEFDMSDGGMGTFTLGTLSNYVLLYRAGQTGNWLEVASASSIVGDRILFNSVGALQDGYVTLGTKNFHNSPLPIALLNFTARAEGKQVALAWNTATEKNNDFFTLEKSKDGESFDAFETVKGAGNSSRLLTYTSKDEAPYSGTSYYRLKQTDYDGKESYSAIVALLMEPIQTELVIFPNPNTGNFKLKFPDSKATEITITVRDILGKEIISHFKISEDADHFFNVNQLPALIAGTYIIIASQGAKEYSAKLLLK